MIQKCEKCGGSHQGRWGLCIRCRSAEKYKNPRYCKFCNNPIPWVSKNGYKLFPLEYEKRSFCSPECDYADRHKRRQMTAASKYVEVKQPLSGRASFKSKAEAMEFIKSLIDKGYLFMNRSNELPKFSKNGSFYGISYVQEWEEKGKMYRAFFITTKESVFKHYRQ